MLDAFRTLGGIAENLRPMSERRGLRTHDPTKPIELRIPESLMVTASDIELAGGFMRVRPSAQTDQQARAFLEAYLGNFSWAAPQQAEVSNFLATLDTLPPEVKALLRTGFGMEEHFAGELADRERTLFLRSRCVRWKDKWFVAPIAELTNHAATGLPCKTDGSGRLYIEGYAQSEVLVSRDSLDTLGIFSRFGVVAAQPQVYSLAVNLNLRSRTLGIGRDTSDFAMHGSIRIPRMGFVDDKMLLSYLMIGNPTLPRLSRGIFLTLARELDISDPDEAFDYILFANRSKFLSLLATLEPYSGDTVVALRRMANLQLERMSHCVGTRNI